MASIGLGQIGEQYIQGNASGGQGDVCPHCGGTGKVQPDTGTLMDKPTMKFDKSDAQMRQLFSLLTNRRK